MALSFNELFDLYIHDRLSDEQMEEFDNLRWNTPESSSAIHRQLMSVIADGKVSTSNENKKNPLFIDIFDVLLYSNGNESNNISNLSTMSTILSKEEISKILQLTQEFNNAYDNSKSLDENLSMYYLKVIRGTSPKEAKEVVNDLKRGILTFNDNLKDAVDKDDLYFTSALDMLSSDLSIEKRYEIFVNFLAVLQTLNISNIDAESMNEIEDFDVFKQRYQVTGEILDKDIEYVRKLINETFTNNSFIMGSVSDINRFVNTVGEGEEVIKEEISAIKDDMDYKMIASMIAFVTYKKREFESLNNADISAEEIAIVTSAAIESARISSDLDEGNITIENAIYALKVVGAVAMLSLLGYTLLIGVVGIFSGITSVMGLNIISIAACVALVGYATCHITGNSIEYKEPIGDKISDYFNLAIAVWGKRVWPTISETINKVSVWLQSQIDIHTIQSSESNSGPMLHQY